MESNCLLSAESQLRNGEISVWGFVTKVAQSDFYQSLFFSSNNQYRFIELNYKHLLGRAPQDQTEISQHVQIYNEQGYEAEIDSYIDSEEYSENFGEWFSYQADIIQTCIIPMFSLMFSSFSLFNPTTRP